MLLLALFVTIGVRAQQQQEQPTLEFVMELRVKIDSAPSSLSWAVPLKDRNSKARYSVAVPTIRWATS